jgi:hypothetical protein
LCSFAWLSDTECGNKFVVWNLTIAINIVVFVQCFQIKDFWEKSISYKKNYLKIVILTQNYLKPLRIL